MVLVSCFSVSSGCGLLEFSWGWCWWWLFACVYICSLLANGEFCGHYLKEFVYPFICVGSGVGSDEA